MNHASLFSGIGGFDLAANWMGWDNALQCEYDEFCQTILKYYWPYATQFKDIKTTDFFPWAGSIDILTGGFPCQPYSNAGKRKGTNDERDQWPQMLRAVQEIKPRFVVGENVPGLLSWNGGLVFEQVCADLEAEGYEVQPLLLPAAGLNAPHRRERLWLVAHARLQRQAERQEQSVGFDELCQKRFTSNAKGERMEGMRANREQKPQSQVTAGLPGCNSSGNGWQNFPAEAPICSGDDGLPTKLDGITFSKWRKESIKGYGNAIVPQVAFQIFKAIQETQSQLCKDG